MISSKTRSAHNAITVTIKGIKFDSIKKACAHLDLDYPRVKARLKYGWSIDEALELKKRKSEERLLIDGKKFRSIRAACVYFKKNYSTVQSRLLVGWTIEEALELKNKYNTSCAGKIYKIKNKVNGKVYIGITIRNIHVRFHKHKNEARKGSNCKFHKAIREFGEKNFNIRLLKEVSCKDKLRKKEVYYINKYNSIVNGYNTCSGNGSIVDFKGLAVEYEGKKFHSISALADYLGLPLNVVRHRLNNNLQLDGVAGSRRGREIKFKNKTYINLSALAKEINVRYGTLYYKLVNKIPVDGHLIKLKRSK